MIRHWGSLGFGIAAVCAAVVMWRAAHAPRPDAGSPLRREERPNVALNVAVNEEEWQKKAEAAFPGDLWSASDDFHGHEAMRVRELARQHKTTYEDILRAVDEDIHRGSKGGRRQDRRASVVPCKPRPFYD